jgi:tyrosine-protein kinase Etk/Wzc
MMQYSRNINIQEGNEFREISDLLFKNYRIFILSIIISIGTAFLLNRYSIPTYRVSASILIKANTAQRSNSGSENDFLYNNLFGGNQSFQNELFIMKSYPIIEKTIRNLDLSVTYYLKGKFNYYEAYRDIPFIVTYLPTHPQPRDIILNISFLDGNKFVITGSAKKVSFANLETNENTHNKNNWTFKQIGTFGMLIETSDLSFIINSRDTLQKLKTDITYGFKFSTVTTLSSSTHSDMEFTVPDKQATVINISLVSESAKKGIDILNELMNVYSELNLERKNHLATITIDYIEKQLNQISDSLAQTEDNLQQFRSSKQLLNITDQAQGISVQYMNLQNQLAELVSKKNYYDYVSDRLKNDNFSDMMLPASIGISDQLLNSLMVELINAQAQRSNLIANNQERNPMVQKLGIQIANLKKTISENISSFSTTANISIEELNKRIRKIEGDINRLPATQRQLTTIERKFRLNDAIYSYLMEKHSEAKITKASNLPDDIIIEQAKFNGQVSPNRNLNYMVAFFLALAVPFSFLWLKNALKTTIETQDEIEHLTDKTVLANIPHNRNKTNNVMFEFPKSNIAESFRALRTNLDFYLRGGQKKVIMVTSSLENEGKSFIAMNLAMSYAQLGLRTILVDFDLRKTKIYFKEGEESREGLSSFMIGKENLEDLIIKSPNDKLDYILAGILPPNPVELLALEKTKSLITSLKMDYDIIVLDTPPLAQVTDAYLLIEYSSVNILVTRCGRTIKKVLLSVIKDLTHKNIGNFCLVLNDNRIYNDQYGYGYGDYNKKGFFHKIIKKKRKRKI